MEQSRHRHGSSCAWNQHVKGGWGLENRVDRSMGIRFVWVQGGRGSLSIIMGWVACVPSIDNGS